MPLVQTRGAASAQGFGEFAQAATAANYIEDVFSTYLYTGAGSSQTITNNIDISTKGGMVWIKCRSAAEPPVVVDTVRGASNALRPSSTAASINDASRVSSFTTTGFTVGSNGETNSGGDTFCSWTFREQAKFFDVVTFTTDINGDAIVSHNLGSTPGMVITKTTASAQNWGTYHRSLGSTGYLTLNTTNAAITFGFNWCVPTSTNVTFTGIGAANTAYVAYLFAHDAGGFGTAGTDNVISCGSFTTDGSGNATVSLGYEPQYFLVKCSSTTDNWYILDVMRGFNQKSAALLEADLASAEATVTAYDTPTATGVNIRGMNPSATFIYMAIRRPMKVPTDATTVFSPVIRTGDGVYTTGFAGDFSFGDQRSPSSYPIAITRLTAGNFIPTTSTGAEQSGNYVNWASNTSFTTTSFYGAVPTVFWNFSRRPGFMDVVCYTGTGTTTTQAHNLGVAPEMMIIKRRSGTGDWFVYSATGIDTGKTYPYPRLNGAEDGWFGTGVINATAPTASVFTISSVLNNSGSTYVTYLFATCPGVSKVGSYTGTGATQTINCGFTGGARFVLIKRTDSTGDWYVWDTARGMVSGTDPSLLLNSTAAEVNANSIYTATTGFQIVSTAAGINASGGTYIFLAIA
jgi:hypothetical protein